MFNTLENTWDRSARRRWTTLASLGFQAMAVSLLLLVPFLWVQGPPKLQWFEPLPVPAQAPAPPTRGQRHPQHRLTNLSRTHLAEPGSIPRGIAQLNEQQIQSAPDVSGIGAIGATGPRGRAVLGPFVPSVEVAPLPPASFPPHPIRVSRWAEGNLIYRVQPLYPPLARQARIQGPVGLRAITSKTGTIESLVVISGHPMLVAAAIEAVRQWRYRPYLLNNGPIEVETEITVNFVLSPN